MTMEVSNQTALLPFELAKKFNILLSGSEQPYKLEYSTLPNAAILSEIQRKYGILKILKVKDNILQKNIQQSYENSSSGDLTQFQSSAEQEDILLNIAGNLHEPLELLNSDDEAPIIRLLNALFAQAILEQASDIHIEPYKDRMRIRFRVHGILKQVMELDIKISPLVISRVKVMARLDIAERRIPQDGRISIQLGSRDVDMRVSTIPSGYSEKAVMRILDKQVGRLELEQLGMGKQHHEQISSLIHKPHGIILVTGPTGSGKTTTLYAALSILNKTKRNIMTVEDPIEYHIDGINQTQINSKINMTFAKGLRAILRQDPDVVMVGEIRDNETAKIAIQASLTGHLVLSTLHTNSTINTVTRLIDMDIEPFLLASTLEAVLAQRLIRKLCDCKTKILVDNEKQMKLLAIDKPVEVYQPQGCEKCGYQGYNSRIGLYELLIIDEQLRSAITRSANEQEIKQIASKSLVTLKTQAIKLVLNGETGLDEAFRVVLV